MDISQAEVEVRERLDAYLRGDIVLKDFADWILSVAWSMDQKKDPSAAKLVYEIELRLFEASNGDRTEDELRQLLRPFVVLERISKPAM